MSKHDDPASVCSKVGRTSATDQDVRDWTVDGLRAFAENLRRASDHIARARPGAVATVVERASLSLERLAVQGRMPAMNDIPRLVRENPAAVVAASILASFVSGDDADALFPADEQAWEKGVVGAPLRTAQTAASGLGYLEEPGESE